MEKFDYVDFIRYKHLIIGKELSPLKEMYGVLHVAHKMLPCEKYLVLDLYENKENEYMIQLRLPSGEIDYTKIDFLNWRSAPRNKIIDYLLR